MIPIKVRVDAELERLVDIGTRVELDELVQAEVSAKQIGGGETGTLFLSGPGLVLPPTERVYTAVGTNPKTGAVKLSSSPPP